MIFGKTKKDDELEVRERPLESAAINRWRNINGSSSDSSEQNESDEMLTSGNLLDKSSPEESQIESVKEEIQIISLNQVFEEDEDKVIRLPEERNDLDLEEPLFNYHVQGFSNANLDEELEGSLEEDIEDRYEDEVDALLEELELEEQKNEPLQAGIEIEETKVTKKAPSRPPLEKADFDIDSEVDLRNRFGDNIQSALGAGTMIEGRFSFEAPVRIDGSLKGEIKSSSALIVGKNAVVNANIKVGSLIILGSVEGEIEADDLIEIRSSGTLLGDVVTKRIALEEGGVFSGSCTMVD